MSFFGGGGETLSIRAELENLVSQEIADIVAKLDEFKTKGDEVGQSVDTLGRTMTASFGEASPVIDATSQSVTTLTQGVTDFETETVNLGAGITQTTGSLEDLRASASSVGADIDTARLATEGLNTATVESDTQLRSLATSFEDVGSRSAELESRTTGLGSSMGVFTGFMGTATSGIFNMVRGYVSLNKAQTLVETLTVRASKATEAEGIAREKLNALMASGTASTQEIAQATLDLEQATGNAAAANERLTNAQDSLNLKSAEFYANIIPNGIQTATSLVAAISQMPQAFNNISTGLSRLTGGFIGGSESANEFSGEVEGAETNLDDFTGTAGETGSELSDVGNDLGTTAGAFTGLQKSMGRIVPVFGVITAVAAAAAIGISIIANNTFGARDALNTFGEAVGNAIPPLEGVLVGIQNVAVEMGIAGDDAKAMADNVDSSIGPIEALGEAWKKTADDMASSSDRGSQLIGERMQQVGDAAKTTTGVIETEVPRWTTALSDFAAAVEREDYSGAIDIAFKNMIETAKGNVKGFESLGPLIGGAIDLGVRTAGVAAMNFIEWASPIVTGLGGALAGKVATVIDTQIAKPFREMDITQSVLTGINPILGIADLISGAKISEAINQHVVTPIQNFITWLQGIKLPEIPGITAPLIPEAGATTDLRSRFQGPNARGAEPPTQFKPTPQAPYPPTIYPQGLDEAVPKIQRVRSEIQTLNPVMSELGVVTNVAAASSTGFTSNFKTAIPIMGDFSGQAAGANDIIKEQSDTLTGSYVVALQKADNMLLQIPPDILASKTATIAYVDAIQKETASHAEAFGAAKAYLTITGQESLAKGKSQAETIALVEGLQQEAESTADVSEQLDDLANKRRTQSLLQEGAIGTEQRLNDARDAGLAKGAAFVNNLLLQQATMDGYRTKLEEAISGQTGWSQSLGLTTHQLELQLSMQSDVSAAQDKIINTLADQVHGLQVNREAWLTLTDAQKENIDSLLAEREALIELQDPLGNTYENLVALQQAFLDGQQGANDFALGLRKTASEQEGYRTGLVGLIKELDPNFSNALDFSTESLENMLGVAMRAPDAINAFKESINSAADALIGMLEFDPEELETKTRDAFEGVPDVIKDLFSENLRTGIVEAADADRAGQMLIDSITAGIKGARFTDDPLGELKSVVIESISTLRDDLDPEVEAAFAPVFAVLDQMAKSTSVTEFVGYIDDLQQAITNATDPLPGFTGGIETLGRQLTPAEKSLAAFNTTADTTATSSEGAGNALGIMIPGLAGVGTEAGNAVGPLNNVSSSIQAIMDKINAARDTIPGFLANVTSQIMGAGQPAPTPTTTPAPTTPMTVPPIDTTAQVAAMNALTTAFNTTSTAALTFRNNVTQTFTDVHNSISQLAATMQTFAPVATSGFNAASTAALTFRNNVAAAFTDTHSGISQMAATAQAFAQISTAAFNAASTSILTLRNNVSASAAGTIAALNSASAAATSAGTRITASLNAASRSALTLRNNAVVAGAGVRSAMSSAGSAVQSFVSRATSGFNAASRSALTLRNNVNSASSGIRSAMSSASSAVTSFASRASSSFSRVSSSARSAQSAVNSLRSSINGLQSKTVTITTRFRTVGSRPAGAQHGFSGIITNRQMLQVGEHNKPEFVSVIPLTNPNKMTDRTVDLRRLGTNIISAQRGLNHSEIRGLRQEPADMERMMRSLGRVIAGEVRKAVASQIINLVDANVKLQTPDGVELYNYHRRYQTRRVSQKL